MNNFKIGEEVKLKDEIGIVLGRVHCSRPYLEVWTERRLEEWFEDEVERTGNIKDSINLKG